MLYKIIRKVAHLLNYDVSPRSPVNTPIDYPFINTLELILQTYQKPASDFFFIQIGAHDGDSADPIHQLVKKHHWRGLLIEPQTPVFHRLKATYKGETQLIFENAAIAHEDGTTTLYAIHDEQSILPFWLSQSASLDRDVVKGVLYYWKQVEKLEALPEDYERLIQELTIPSLTVKTLLAKHHIQEIDLLVIDTMGFDFEIIKMFPFDLVKPSIIHFEHSLLSATYQELCFKYLASLGYGLTTVAVDTIAYLHAPIRQGRYLLPRTA
jgi:FkbM family methyltransferase